MLNQSFFLLVMAFFFMACGNTTSTENTKTENASVNNSTSQPISPSQKPIDTPSQTNNEQSTPPDSPSAQTGETDVTNTEPPTTSTAPQPSPEKTNVAPAREVEKPTASPRTTSTPTPPTTRTESKSTETVSPTVSTNKPEEKIKKQPKNEPIQKVEPPVSSGEKDNIAKVENPPTLSHQAFDGLLKKYVSSSGKVNYKGFKSNIAQLDTYLELLKNNPPQSSWSRNKTMAYWINAYNAFTVKLIVDNYPVSSITKLEGGKPWDKKWINIGSKTYSLNNIENDILRPKYKDARIHFAVNCAAKSCPPLLNRAWTASNLNSNFEKQAKAFINNASFNNIAAKKIQVSKIFEWYAEDFGNLIDYLNEYSTTEIKSSADVGYMEYNWDLNE